MTFHLVVTNFRSLDSLVFATFSWTARFLCTFVAVNNFHPRERHISLHKVTYISINFAVLLAFQCIVTWETGGSGRNATNKMWLSFCRWKEYICLRQIGHIYIFSLKLDFLLFLNESNLFCLMSSQVKFKKNKVTYWTVESFLLVYSTFYKRLWVSLG